MTGNVNILNKDVETYVRPSYKYIHIIGKNSLYNTIIRTNITITVKYMALLYFRFLQNYIGANS